MIFARLSRKILLRRCWGWMRNISPDTWPKKILEGNFPVEKTGVISEKTGMTVCVLNYENIQKSINTNNPGME
jgi:hypothetical protein